MQVVWPSLTNCSPAICSPKLAPPGRTRTLSELHVVCGAGGGADVVDELVDGAVLDSTGELSGGADVAGAVDGVVATVVGVVGGTRVGVFCTATGRPDDVHPASRPATTTAVRNDVQRAALPRLTNRSA